MAPLFFSCVCDYCDGMIAESEFDEGFVVMRDETLPREAYVFRSRQDAEVWRTRNSLFDHDIRRVKAPVRFTWRESTGSIKGVTTANRLITIYPDHRFPPQPNRAYLDPCGLGPDRTAY